MIDIVPTLLELSGGQPIGQWHGRPKPAAPGKSLVPLLAADAPAGHETIWWQHEGNRALRRGDWKIVAAGNRSPWELYDLAHDRAESHDLAAAQPDRVRELAALWQAQADANAKLARGEVSDEEREKQ